MLTLTQLWIYPIKSLGGFQVSSAMVTPRGLQHDRRWMLIDDENVFLSQRELPEMALLQTAIEGNVLKIWHKAKDIAPLEVQIDEPTTPERLTVDVWGDQMPAVEVSSVASLWFSEVLGFSCKLVFMPEDSLRPIDPRYAKTAEDVSSFSDGYPCLIIGQESLNLLNNKLENPIPINRFRANLIFEGGQAHIEDTWKEFRVGQITFWGVKPCARCNVPTIDQNTGIASKEPLKTLASYRLFDKKILFGQNLIPAQTGTIHIGDVIDVVG
jgi:uncharacterized protein